MSGDGTRVFILGGEDLDRGRLMVPLRYILAVPHYIWLGIFRLFLLIALPFNWIFTVINGRQPAIFYEFTSGYIRYRSDVLSYLTLLADPYPGFAAIRSYPVETWVPPFQQASRLSLFFRPLLVLPALLLVALIEWRRRGGGHAPEPQRVRRDIVGCQPSSARSCSLSASSQLCSGVSPASRTRQAIGRPSASPRRPPSAERAHPSRSSSFSTVAQSISAIAQRSTSKLTGSTLGSSPCSSSTKRPPWAPHSRTLRP